MGTARFGLIIGSAYLVDDARDIVGAIRVDRVVVTELDRLFAWPQFVRSQQAGLRVVEQHVHVRGFDARDSGAYIAKVTCIGLHGEGFADIDRATEDSGLVDKAKRQLYVVIR